MTKFEVTIIFAVFLKTMIMTTFSESTDTTMFHQTNDKILNILDDLFLALKINRNVSKLKNVQEYMPQHSLIQDELYKNHKTYKEIRDISKTNISHKTAYYISNVNEVVDEMIRNEIIIKHENDTSNNTLSERQDFVNLARRFNLNVKTIAATVLKLPSTKKLSKDEARRIFEGSSTGIKRYPFMVSVQLAGRFVCAGSLVHESLALSTASCLMRPSDLNAHVQIRVASDFVSKKGYLINIDELIFHPQFNRKTLANNLMLLRTRKALRFRQQRVVAIQYDTAATSALKPSVKNVVILGWGRRKTDEADLPEEDRPLSEAKVELYDFSACQYIYTKEFVTDKAFCAGFVDRGAGACNHDAGGPALVDNVLVGVISFGSPHCGAAEAPTVFTRLSPYDKWIESEFQKLSQVTNHGTCCQRRSRAGSRNSKISSEINELRDFTENNEKDEILNVDEAMKDVYRENFNVNDVLYGPIETLDDNENPIIVNQSFLHDFPSDPSMFPNPEFVANLLQTETPEPIPDIPDEYWRDVPSNEQTDPTSENYAPADQFDTRTMATMTTNLAYGYGSQGIYEDIDESTNEYTTTEASLIKNDFDNTLNDIKTNPDEENCAICKKGNKKVPKASNSIRGNPKDFDDYQTEPIRFQYPRRDPIELKQPRKSKIERFEDDTAVIVMLDSGTTERIEVHKNDPVYKRGFKVLAAKIRQAQELV
ncbi:uncharacterized protein LOC134658160 [Cydia amplana]|uniref:uncharacterized protein LOC134658160 n=1 Tax=Cydia amplana TaxID=1869771 RepID=UPI002FE6B683